MLDFLPEPSEPNDWETCPVSSANDSGRRCCYYDACDTESTICAYVGKTLTDSCPASYTVDPDCKLSHVECCVTDACTGEQTCLGEDLFTKWRTDEALETFDNQFFCTGLNKLASLNTFCDNPFRLDSGLAVAVGMEIVIPADFDDPDYWTEDEYIWIQKIYEWVVYLANEDDTERFYLTGPDSGYEMSRTYKNDSASWMTQRYVELMKGRRRIELPFGFETHSKFHNYKKAVAKLWMKDTGKKSVSTGDRARAEVAAEHWLDEFFEKKKQPLNAEGCEYRKKIDKNDKDILKITCALKSRAL